MRWVWIPVGFLGAVVLMLALFGWRGQTGREPPREVFDDMTAQPRYNPQAGSAFFADGRAMRPSVAGTVPFGGTDYVADAGSPTPRPDLLREDDGLYRGTVRRKGWFRDVDVFVAKMPVKPDAALLARGKERYGTFCAVCHGGAGYGDGITTRYGMVGVANFHQDRFRQMPDGEIFNVITNGKGTMQPYSAQIKPADRWAVVAWLRVLQRSQNARLDDVPAAHRGDLERQK